MRTLIQAGVLVALSAAAVACSETPQAPKPKELTILPENVYSGFDGTHSFKAPVAVYEAGSDLTVTAEDPSAVEVTPTALLTPGKTKELYFMLTVKKDGVHKVIARSKGKEKTVTLTATKYDAADWAAGAQRYSTATMNGNAPCTQCHRGGGIDHSPAALAAVNDTTVNKVITNGTTVFGARIKIDGQAGHKWAVSDGDRRMLVTYLRGLEPVGFK
jgi:hypothetical protein